MNIQSADTTTTLTVNNSTTVAGQAITFTGAAQLTSAPDTAKTDVRGPAAPCPLPHRPSRSPPHHRAHLSADSRKLQRERHDVRCHLFRDDT